jgi:predicted membrane protein
LGFIFRNKLQGSEIINESDSVFDVVSVFGGSKQIVSGNAVKGGRVTSIFGGSEIDLRSANLSTGATVEVFTMFGAAEILVPGDWHVNVEVSSVFGGFENKRTPVTSPNAPSLRIKGFTMFGGGEVKS